MSSFENGPSPRERFGESLAKSGKMFASRFGTKLQNLDLNDKLDQAKGSIQKLELSSKLENSRRKIAAEMRDRRVVERIGESTSKISSTIRTEIRERRVVERIGDTKQIIGSTVGDATVRIGDKLSHIDVRDASKKIGTAVGGVTHQIGDRIGSIVNSPSNDEEQQRRERNLKQHLEAEEMMRDAEAACTKVIETHLAEFIEHNPTGTYEEWLCELHPDNNYEGILLEGFSELDHRFYIESSDHRLLWNKNLDGIRREVPARYITGSPKQNPGQPGNTTGDNTNTNEVVDLLDLSFTPFQPQEQQEQDETIVTENEIEGVQELPLTDNNDAFLLPLDNNCSPSGKSPSKTMNDSDLNATDLTYEEDLLL